MLKVVFHEKYKEVYSSDPASAPGRIEEVVKVIEEGVEWVEAREAERKDLLAVHTTEHLDWVRRSGVYDIAALAAGGAVQAAHLGLEQPAFALIRPPGHHASRNSAWGFCYFNNMAVALENLRRSGRINRAFVLDIDLHYGDGTENILGGEDYVTIHNVDAVTRDEYLNEVARNLPAEGVDVIGISAGFDHHVDDWGGLLETSDYREIGRMASEAAGRGKAGLFAILEGGYNHSVLGHNVRALLQGMEEGWS